LLFLRILLFINGQIDAELDQVTGGGLAILRASRVRAASRCAGPRCYRLPGAPVHAALGHMFPEHVSRILGLLLPAAPDEARDQHQRPDGAHAAEHSRGGRCRPKTWAFYAAWARCILSLNPTR